jgi:predicted transposase YbfD/YdcC
MESPRAYFSGLPDPRIKRRQLHDFQDVIMLVLCGVIAGCDEWTSIEEYAKSKITFLKTFLGLQNGIPSHDTFGDIFAKIAPLAFEECFLQWTLGVCKCCEGEIVSIDGKQLRGSYDSASNKAAIHMVSAWANANRMVLGQIKVDNKSNEITAIPYLLNVLVLKGCIVTIDAMGCQKAIAQQIIDAEADYVLALKGNQGLLHEQVKDSFEREPPTDTYTEYNNDHGRVETRRYEVLTDLKWIEEVDKWEQLTTLVKVQAEVFYKRSQKTTTETRYYISSLPIIEKQKDIKTIAKAVRAHWGIETSLHWCLDVAFNEDKSRVRLGYADQNLSMVRKIALNLLRKEQTIKKGIKTKRLRAGWNDEYLKALLHI